MSAAVGAGGARGARVEAQAKINLRLRVLAREATGFHQLETLFLRLALADEVTVRVTDGSRTLDVRGDVDAGALGPTERNLAWRAAESYATHTGWPAGFAIELDKRIPIGGGLGGGSADAGAVLRALDAIAPNPVGEPRLLALAARLGSDVPFLTTSHPFALGWGRGERLLALTPPAQREVMLLLPSFGVNTADAYGWLASSRTGAVTPPEPDVFDPAALSDWSMIASVATNDFEPVVAARHPQIAALVEQLRKLGCAPAMMSGSGSTVFGVIPEAGSLAQRPPGDGEEVPAPRVLFTWTALRVEPVVPLY